MTVLRTSVLALALAACVGSAACTKVDDATAPGASTSGASAGNAWTHHGSLVIAENQDAKSLDPVLAASASVGDMSYFLFSYAVRYDDKGRPVPDALREVPTVENGDVSKDGLTLKY